LILTHHITISDTKYLSLATLHDPEYSQFHHVCHPLLVCSIWVKICASMRLCWWRCVS